MNVGRSVLLFHDGLAEGQVPVMLHTVALPELGCLWGTPLSSSPGSSDPGLCPTQNSCNGRLLQESL